MIIWIIGLSGAGKTVIGRAVHAQLKERRSNVAFVDGDAIRAIMGNDLGHDMEDRRVNAWRLCRLCMYLDEQGIDVVCAVLSIFPETREWLRRHSSHYFEVFIDVPLSTLTTRDDKGVYRAAREGRLTNVVGIDIPFVPPQRPDLRLRNSYAAGSAEILARRIVEAADTGAA